MIKLYLVEKTKTYVKYEYYPEDKGKPGILQLDLKTGEVSVIQKAGNDDFGIYTPHAYRKLKGYFEAGNYPEEDSSTWF